MERRYRIKNWGVITKGTLAYILMMHGLADAGSTVGSKVDTMEVAEAVMVTVELDFGLGVPSLANAMKEVDRRYHADDGQDRTFAILEAFGEPTQDGKLHLSMHISTEKPGVGSLILRRTGDTLWTARIVAGSKPGGRPQGLGIMIEDATGRQLRVIGSNNPGSILEAGIQGSEMRVRDSWPNHAERKLAFLYSACGCPVKVKARRIKDQIIRIGDSPLVFPDDPAVVDVIRQLMKW